MIRLAPDARVLVVDDSDLASSLLITPSLRALKAAVPQGQLKVVVPPLPRAALRHLPYVDHVSTLSPWSSAWWSRWKGRTFDVALVFGQEIASFRYARRVAEYTVGFRPGSAAANRLLDCAVDPSGESAPLMRAYAALPEAVHVLVDDDRLDYALFPPEVQAARAWLASRVGTDPTIGIYLDESNYRPSLAWPVERYVELISGLLARWPFMKFLLLGPSAAKAKLKTISAAFQKDVVFTRQRSSLRQAVATMSQLALYVGIDGGMTRIASALGMPGVALYHCSLTGGQAGPSQHLQWEAVEHPALIARRDAAMAEIQASMVLSAIDRLVLRLPEGHPLANGMDERLAC